MAAISGKVMRVTYKGEKIECETDATLDIDKDVQTGTPCKDDGGWATKYVGSKTWSITVNVKAFLQSAPLTQLDIIADMLDETTGDDAVAVEFTSTVDPHSNEQDATFSGMAIVSNASWASPSDGESTTDFTFEGTGPLTLTREPHTT